MAGALGVANSNINSTSTLVGSTVVLHMYVCT